MFRETYARDKPDMNLPHAILSMKLIGVLMTVVLGIPNQIIDYKHRKRKAYEPGDAWAYYSKLSKEGNFDGKFMMFSTYVGITVIIAVISFAAYVMFTAKP